MSVRFVVAAVVGVAVGYFSGSPQAGFTAFSLIYGVSGFLDPNTKVQGPRLNDLKFPAASYGSPIPYIEGHPRLGGIVAWSIDPKREVANTQTTDGKGGPGVDSTTYTYEVDMRIILSENTGFKPRRCWSNGALIWSAAEDADAETLTASSETISWRELRVYTGEDDQMPDPTEEAYVGYGLSPAYRGRSSIVIVGLNCGQSGQLPILTWEITNGDESQFPARTKLQSYFEEDTTDISAYHIGAATLGNQAVVPIGGGSLDINATGAPDDGTATWVSANLTHDSVTPITIEFFLTWHHTKNEAPIPAMTWQPNTLSSSVDRIQFAGPDGYWQWIGGSYASPIPLAGEGHFRIVYTPSMSTLYFNGAPVATGAGLPGVPGATGRITLGCVVGSMAEPNSFSFRAFALRAYEMNTGAFSPPPQLEPPDAGHATYALAEPTRAEALQNQMTRAGLDPALLDVSLVTGDVRAMAVSALTSARAVMENIASTYPPLEFVETGDGIKVVPRGGAPVRTIPYEDMGAFNGDSPPEPLPRVRGNELEITSQVSIKFANVDDDYRDGTETSTRLATGSSIVTVAEVPMGLTPTEAKRLAEVAVADAAASITRIGPVSLARKHADLEPCDVVILTGKDGSTYRVRITKKTEGGGIVTIEGVEDDASVISSDAVTSGGYTSSTTLRSWSPVDATYIDGPLLSEADDYRGEYVAAAPTGTKFSSYAVLKSPDDVTYAIKKAGIGAATKGVCTTVPGDWPTRTFNERDGIVCNLGTGEAASTTRAEILADKSVNSFLIGAHGRWLFGQFRDAELQSAGVYKLTGLLLGDLGTEHNIGTQEVGDEIVMLAQGGIARIPADASDLGVSRFYKAVSYGRSITNTPSEAFTEYEVALQPHSPVYLRANRAGGDIALRWTRRSRYATVTAGPSAPIVPLAEESEAWSIDIFSDGTYSTVKRTLTSATTSVTYTTAMQTADFLGPQSVVFVRVRQISGLVGPGIPLLAAA